MPSRDHYINHHSHYPEVRPNTCVTAVAMHSPADNKSMSPRRISFAPRAAGRLLFLLTSSIFVNPVSAQLAVSATAAWSSQIVAFWGALIVGVRSSNRTEVSNAVTTFVSSLSVWRRSRQICKLLQRGDWLLHSGWEHGKTRMDVVLICWRTPEDLASLALQISMQIEVLGDFWEVLVCGRQLRNAGAICRAHWMQSPRCADFCAARVIETSQNYFPFDMQRIAEAILDISSGIDQIATTLVDNREERPSRCAYFSEVRREMQEEQTLARYFTNYSRKEGETPFVHIAGMTAQFGSARRVGLKSASRMYALLHLTVAVAIGLMGAASGRGLAIWLMTLRPTLQNLGTATVSGNSVILSLLGFDGSILEYETQMGSQVLAGDVSVYGLSWWSFLSSVALPSIEFGILIAGWLYGAWNVEKLRPSGVVGHGMLWLAVLVALSLSIRTALGIRQRISGRLIGIFITHDYNRFVIGATVPLFIEPMLASSEAPSELCLAARLLRECPDDNKAIIAASGVMRHPATCTILADYVVTNVLKYQYSGDTLTGRGDPPKPVTTPDAYPWIQSSCCVLITVCCACVSAAYAYLPFPKWVKLVVEVLLATSAVWFATLERTSQLKHNRDSYVCHMVATMVVSAVWYVGVQGNG